MIKRQKMWLILAAFLWSCLISRAGAVDLLPLGLPSAVKATGGAGLASFDGLSGWFLNPALIAQVKTPGLTSIYSGLSGDASIFGLQAVYPTDFADLAIGFLEAGSGSFLHTRATAGGGVEVLDEFSYSDRWLTLAASKNINQMISLGGQIKYVQEGFSGPFGQGKGLVTDFSLLGRISDKIQIGLVVQNFLLHKIDWSGAGAEILPTHLKAGLAVKVWPDLDLTLDGDYCSYYPLVFKAGADWSINSLLDLRLGVTQQPLSPGRVDTGYTLGLGLNLGNFSFDYAFCPGLVLEGTTAHYFSLSYRFDPESPSQP